MNSQIVYLTSYIKTLQAKYQQLCNVIISHDNAAALAQQKAEEKSEETVIQTQTGILNKQAGIYTGLQPLKSNIAANHETIVYDLNQFALTLN